MIEMIIKNLAAFIKSYVNSAQETFWNVNPKEPPHSLETLDIVAELSKENQALKAQLHNVGLEFINARDQIRAYEREKLIGLSDEARAYRERLALVLLPKLFNILDPLDRISIVEGGSREMELDPRWRSFPPDRLLFYCFECDPHESDRLSAHDFGDQIERRFYAAGLWGTSGRLVFEHNNTPGASSFLRLNRKITDRWKFENNTQAVPAPNMCYPTSQQELDVINFSDWATFTGVTSIDFMKLNIQGGEFDVLRSAGPVGDTFLGLLVEVAFVESYIDRPMFSDLDVLLRERGYVFFDLIAHHYIGRALSPVAAQHLAVVDPKFGTQVSAWGQLIEGHALYLRDPIFHDDLQMAPDRVIKLAILSEAFGQIEYAFELIVWLRDRSDVRGTILHSQLEALLIEAKTQYDNFSKLKHDSS